MGKFDKAAKHDVLGQFLDSFQCTASLQVSFIETFNCTKLKTMLPPGDYHWKVEFILFLH